MIEMLSITGMQTYVILKTILLISAILRKVSKMYIFITE